MVMRFVAILVLPLLATACGDKDPEGRPSSSRDERPAPTFHVCPVNGVSFQQGTGVKMKAGRREVEVCSRGCAYQYEADPDAFPDAGQDR